MSKTLTYLNHHMAWFSKIIFLILIFGSGNALECYTCSSHNGLVNAPNACEQFNFYENHKKSICMPGEVCTKTVVNHDGMIWVHKSCRPYDICSYLSGIYRNGRDQLLECATCADRNLCNSGSMNQQFLLLIILVLFIAMKIY
ncbi:uncharacterized protein [Euwallacea similis]|uniref:uncharacterized protein isoform X2 n=1 Tax=Euwallacea similis TaxID=1736056 RepID=UPI00344F7B24